MWEFLILLGQPQMYAWVLVAGHEPSIVGRPDKRVDAVGIGEFLLRDEIVGIPQAHTAEISHGHASARRLPRERGDGLGRPAVRRSGARTRDWKTKSRPAEAATQRLEVLRLEGGGLLLIVGPSGLLPLACSLLAWFPSQVLNPRSRWERRSRCAGRSRHPRISRRHPVRRWREGRADYP